MKKPKLNKLLFLLLVLSVSIGTASAAQNAYLKVTGETQGWIKGSSPVTSLDREDTIEVYAMEHGVTNPIDASSGLPAGKRQHHVLTITKQIDQATPQLYQALVTNELLTDVVLRFYRPSPSGDGTTEQYYTITLENAKIVDMKAYFPLTLLPDNYAYYKHMEDVSFAYQTITWTYEDGGITASDSWAST